MKLSSEPVLNTSVLLVTDDHPTNRELRHAFASAAPQLTLNVARRRDEVESLEVPALLLLDLVLSGEPAIDLLQWFRGDPRYESVAVIALAPAGLEQLMARAYALGVNSCLLKTAEPQSLELIVRGIASYTGLIGRAGLARSN